MMKPEQIIFRDFVYEIFSDQKNIENTILWISRHMLHFRYERPDIYRAHKKLSSKEINQVYSEVLLPF